MKQPIRVLIVDDHEVVRRGIKALLHEYPDIRVIGEAANGFLAISLAERLLPDIILMDLIMPEMDGIEATQQILTLQPDQAIIILTAYMGNDILITAIRAGAKGYVLKDAQTDRLVQTIRSVYGGEAVFNPEKVNLENRFDKAHYSVFWRNSWGN